MNAQPSLFEHAPTRGRSRKTGPATSKAGADIMSGGRLREQQAKVLHAVADLGTANAHEVQDWLAERDYRIERNAVGSRFAELRDLGWVRMLPKDQHTKVGQVHEATDAGRQRLARYLETEAA